MDEPIRFVFRTKALIDIENVNLRVCFTKDDGTPSAAAFVHMDESFKADEFKDTTVTINKHNLAPGDYKVSLLLTQGSVFDNYNNIDAVEPEAFFVSVLNICEGDKDIEDDASRMWCYSWGRSRIMDVTSESETVK